MRRSILLLVLALAASQPSTSQAQPADSDPADVQFRLGNAAYKDKRFAEARTAFEAAFHLKQTHDIAVNLGFAEIKLELWRDAAAHLSFGLRNWAPTGKAASRESAVKFLAAAKEKVGTLTVTVAAGAEVLIDGKPAGTAPLDELFVEPGTHTVGARREGFDPVEQTVQAEKGKSYPVALTLIASAPPPPPQVSATHPVPSTSASGPVPLPASPVVPPRAGPPPALIVTSGVLAAGGLGAGIGLTVAANHKASDEATLQLGPSACVSPGANAAACSTLHAAASSKVTLSNAAVSAFLGGSALALVTGGLGIWMAVSPKAAPVLVVPTVGADRAGLTVVGVW